MYAARNFAGDVVFSTCSTNRSQLEGETFRMETSFSCFSPSPDLRRHQAKLRKTKAVVTREGENWQVHVEGSN